MELMEKGFVTELREPLAFHQFSPIEILPQGPAGASGEVWRMRLQGTELDCVFKVICVPLSSDEEINMNLQGVKNAWRSGCPGAGSRQHPGIATLLDCAYDRASNRFLIATEWMDGLSLRDHIRPYEGIPETVVGVIAKQILEALAFLHKECHRAHRDLKPGNVLLSTKGQVKVTDLGQSKQLEQTRGAMGTYVGSQIYMSPQRIQGAQYTIACDIWSLGLMTHECLVGEFPYLETLRAQNKDPNNCNVIELMEEGPPRSLSDAFSPAAIDFCDRALSFSEESRPSAHVLMHHAFVVSCSDPQPLGAWVAASLPKINGRQAY